MRLTDIKLRALKPQDTKRYYVTDGRGLSIEVFPSGAMAWRYRYQLGGKTEKVALGRYPDISLRDARLRRDELAILRVPHSDSVGRRPGLDEADQLRLFERI